MDLTDPHLEDFLRQHRPFDALGAERISELARDATVRSYRRGDLILDAFRTNDDAVFVVLSGRVDLWFSQTDTPEGPDATRGPGGVFGFSAMLTERSLGPRVVAATDCRVVRLPGAPAATAFTSKTGASFLAEDLLSLRRVPRPPTYSLVDDLVVEAPVVVRADEPISDVARRMAGRRHPCAVVELPRGQHALVTNLSLRQHVVIDGVPPSAPVSMAIDASAPTVMAGDSATEALVAMLDRGSEEALVVDLEHRPLGVVSVRDFAMSPTTADLSLHERLRNAGTTDALVDLARRVPDLLDDLLGRGLASGRVIAVYSSMVDAVARRTIDLVLAGEDDLCADDFTWLSLGSNGRREAVLSSDIDSAVVFVGDPTPAQTDAYRRMFSRVTEVLNTAGLTSDDHGATAARAAFSRTATQWRDAARDWVDAPERNQGAMMTSLLVDGRPIYGDQGLREVADVFRGIRTHPETLRLLLEESLAKKPRRRAARDRLRRRPGELDLKRHALLPVVNLARWAALSVGSPALTTPDRLRSAAGSAMFPGELADTLVEVFEVLQRLRLRYQLMQHEAGRPPSDRLLMRDMSTIDRSLFEQAVRQIATAQRRMANVSAYVEVDEWNGPTRPTGLS